MKIHPDVIGIDVSKMVLDVYEGRGGTWRQIGNDDKAIEAFVDGLAGLGVLVVLEATGLYDRKLRRALSAAGVRFTRVNPERARSFARATGLLAKTDKVDARMLAAFGTRLECRLEPAPDPDREALNEANRRRDQLVAMRQQEKNRLADGSEGWQESIRRMIEAFDREIATCEATIRDLVRSRAELRRLEALLRSIPGIGPVAATTLLALMPELGRLSPKQIAALAGLAPFARDSGRFRGQRSILGGRKRVRDALYMGALAAIRHCPRFKTFFQTLRDAGKPFKLALVAVSRKLLVTANAVIRDQMPFHA